MLVDAAPVAVSRPRRSKLTVPSWRTEGARYGVGVGNLFDRQFYKPSAYFGGGQVTPAQGRTVTASAQFDF